MVSGLGIGDCGWSTYSRSRVPPQGGAQSADIAFWLEKHSLYRENVFDYLTTRIVIYDAGLGKKAIIIHWRVGLLSRMRASA